MKVDFLKFSLRCLSACAGASFLAVLPAACGGAEETCTQAAVDGCYDAAECGDIGACRVTASGMNELCGCFESLDCDQAWYHAYCDDAPYDTEGGCPLCAD